MLEPERYKLLCGLCQGVPRGVPLEVRAGDLQDLLLSLNAAVESVLSTQTRLNTTMAILERMTALVEALEKKPNQTPVPSRN